jgi:hypothetical protein
MERRPRVNEWVRVPFGLKHLEAKVIDVHGKGELTWVMVEMYPDDPEHVAEPAIMSYLLREVQPAQAA